MTSSDPIIGIISPPGWYDPTADELAELVTQSLRMQQTFVPAPDIVFDDLANVAAQEDNLMLCARGLSHAAPDIVAMSGTPFVWAGLTDEAAIRNRQARLAEAAGCPAVFAGTAIIDALKRLNVRKVAIAAPYYIPSWKEHAAQVFTAFGFDALTVMATDDAGQTDRVRSIDDHLESSRPEAVIGTVEAVHMAAPKAEAIALLGAGVRTLSHLRVFEERFGKPFVAADTALFWAICDTLGLTPKPGCLGKLGELLD